MRPGSSLLTKLGPNEKVWSSDRRWAPQGDSGRLVALLFYCTASLLQKHATSFQPLKVLNGYGLNWISEWEAEDAGVEVEFGLEGAFDVFSATETVTFAIEGQIGYGYSPGS